MTTKDTHYLNFIQELKQVVAQAQQQAAMAVNSRLLFSYWQIGLRILEEQENQEWGSKVIEQIAQDLSKEFPKMKGLSKRNLFYMRSFAQSWSSSEIVQQAAAQLKNPNNPQKVQQPVAQLKDGAGKEITQQAAAQFEVFEKHPIAHVPWSHHMLLLDKLESKQERLFYCQKIKENAWSRKLLLNQLDRKLHLQQGALSNNFEQTLSRHQAAVASNTFKDPYFFDFLQLGEEASELEIEEKLVKQISDFLLELGSGFAYMGRQFKLEVGAKEYRLDLLFYHTKLRSYVNIELKIDEFKPEYVGKSQFYLTAINDLIKSEADNPSIGIILCKSANSIVVEYALKDNKAPIGIAQYTLKEELPEEMKGQLPTAAEFEANMKLSQNEEE